MKNFFKLMGIIAMVAIIGFSMAACDLGDDSDNDSGDPPIFPVEMTENWVSGGDYLSINNPWKDPYASISGSYLNFLYTLKSISGNTYTVASGDVTFSFTATVSTDLKEMTITGAPATLNDSKYPGGAAFNVTYYKQD